MNRLEGKVAIITGAASGIGKATAQLFAREGARVVLGDLAGDDLQQVISQINADGFSAIGQTTDTSKQLSVDELVALAMDNYRQVDVLFNNAGIVGAVEDIADSSDEGWLRVHAVNVLGPVHGVKAVTPIMRKNQYGSIINTASVAGVRAGAGPNAYSASKAAVINFTQTAACDLGVSNVRVNAICPGLIETGMTKPAFDYAKEAGKEEKLGSRCELRRYGKPIEIANTVLFLASDDASYITGQAICVDGGNTASLNLPGMKY